MEISLKKVWKHMPKHYEAIRKGPYPEVFAAMTKELKNFLLNARDPKYIDMVKRTYTRWEYETLKYRTNNPEALKAFLMTTRFKDYPEECFLYCLAQHKFQVVFLDHFICKGHTYVEEPIDESGHVIKVSMEEIVKIFGRSREDLEMRTIPRRSILQKHVVKKENDFGIEKPIKEDTGIHGDLLVHFANNCRIDNEEYHGDNELIANNTDYLDEVQSDNISEADHDEKVENITKQTKEEDLEETKTGINTLRS